MRYHIRRRLAVLGLSAIAGISMVVGSGAVTQASATTCATGNPSGGGLRQDGMRNRSIRIVYVHKDVTRMTVGNTSGSSSLYSGHPRVGTTIRSSGPTVFIKVFTNRMGGCMVKYDIVN